MLMAGGGYDNAAYQTPPLSRAHLFANSSASNRPQTIGGRSMTLRPQPLGHAGPPHTLPDEYGPLTSSSSGFTRLDHRK